MAGYTRQAFVQGACASGLPAPLVFPATAIAILAGAHPPFGSVLLPFVEYRVRLRRACSIHRAAQPSHGAAGEFKELHPVDGVGVARVAAARSEEHTSELQSLRH